MFVCLPAARRYSRAITAIKDLLTEWESISPVQKASPDDIARLVVGGETILNDERLAWQRTGLRKDTGVEGQEVQTNKMDKTAKTNKGDKADKDREKRTRISIVHEELAT